MPKGIYKHKSPSVATRKKMSKSRKKHIKNNPNSTAFKKGHIPWFKLIGLKTPTDGIPWNKDKKCPQFGGEKCHFWKGGKINNQGYIYKYFPNHPYCMLSGYIAKHRLIVEQQIGRYLLSTERVHHLGAKDDNRLHMLMAFINESAHQRFHTNPNNVKPEEIIYDGRNQL